MPSFARFGNDLYFGRRAIDFVGRKKIWYTLSLLIIVLAAVGIFGRGLNLSLEFRGGAQFQVTGVKDVSNYDQRATNALKGEVGNSNLTVTKLGQNSIRVQTERLSSPQTGKVEDTLASTFKVPAASVSSTEVGASWGQQVSNKALKALITFLVLVSIMLALYFRTWKMSLAALVALAHDLIITVGVYALAGFEISPATMIGFLTILGYSLYDTVVVFDKVRENTRAAMNTGRQSYSQAANQAVNQTLVRSINTSVVALLPVASILAVGFFFLGQGTLLDLSLALFVGIAAGTYSSIFIATPLLADLREREPAMKEQAKRATRYQRRNPEGGPAVAEPADPATAPAAAGSSIQVPVRVGAGEERDGAGPNITASGRPLHPYAQTGPRNQPKHPPRSRR